MPKQGIPGPCTGQQAAASAGAWILQPANLSELAMRKLTPAGQKRLEAKAAAAIDILCQAYPAPQGHDVWFYRNAVHIPEPTLPSMIEASLIFMKYICYSNYCGTGPRLIPEITSDAWVTVRFNSFSGSRKQPLPDGCTLPGGLPMYHTETLLKGAFRGVPIIGGRPERNSTTIYIASKPHLPLRPVTREALLPAHRQYWLKKTHEDQVQPAESSVHCFQRTLAEMDQRRASLASIPPYRLRRLYSVWSVTPSSRATARAGRPASICLTASIICS